MVTTILRISYASIILFTQSLLGIWNLYHVNMFLNVYKLDSHYFYVGQLLFAIWNALNDPLFGYLSDFLRQKYGYNRGIQIWAAVPLFSIGFLLPWYQWTENPFLHFVVSLLVWDGAYTWIILAHCSLLPEISLLQIDRGQITTLTSLAGLIGSFSIFPTWNLFTSHDLSAFRSYCLVLAAISFVGLSVAVYFINGECSNTPPPLEKDDSALNTETFWQFFLQITRNTNFLVFVSINFAQIFFQSIFESFKILFIQSLVLSQIGEHNSGRFFVFVTLTPMIFSVLTSFLSIQVETHSILNNIFITRVALSILCLIIPHPITSAFFLIVGSVSIGSVGRLLEVSLSDLVDEDFVVQKRLRYMSSSIFGINALITKPAFSLGPSFGAYVLKASGSNVDSGNLFTLLAGTSIVMGILQIFIWKFYTLKGDYLSKLKKEEI